MSALSQGDIGTYLERCGGVEAKALVQVGDY